MEHALRTLRFLVYYESTSDACRKRKGTISTSRTSAPQRSPKILINSEQLTLAIKTRKPHPIRVGLEHLIPAPEHIPVHVVLDGVFPTQEEGLGCEDGGVAGGDCACVYGFGVGAFEAEEDCLRGVVPVGARG